MPAPLPAVLIFFIHPPFNSVHETQNYIHNKLVKLGNAYQFTSVLPLSRVQLLATPWTAARQASLSTTNSQSPPKPMSIESTMPSNHLFLCRLLLLLQSFPASGSFPVSWHFTSGGPSFGASAPASVLPMNIQDWCPLGCTGLISLLSEGSSGVFSSTAGWKHWFRELEQCSWSHSIPVRETRRQPGFLLSRWVDFYQATFPQTGLVLQTGV